MSAPARLAARTFAVYQICLHMQTILGAGGAIGRLLATELYAYTDIVRLVSRRPERVQPSDALFPADLLDADATRRAVEGSAVVYLTAGLPYHTKTWERDWPLLIDNVLDACASTGAKLVFFDNVYSYAPDQLDGMMETARVAPATRKGRVRAAVATRVLEAHRSGRVSALIARSADFYGKGIANSVLNDLIITKLQTGKRPQWLCDADQPHNFTLVSDAARATAQLGNDPEAYGQVWHLPTVSEAPTAREWIAHFGGNQAPQLLRPWLVRLLGLGIPALGALHEMLYQYDRPYRFDSSAFTARYGWSATPIAAAVADIMYT